MLLPRLPREINGSLASDALLNPLYYLWFNFISRRDKKQKQQQQLTTTTTLQMIVVKDKKHN